jgi:hypothetical protein
MDVAFSMQNLHGFFLYTLFGLRLPSLPNRIFFPSGPVLVVLGDFKNIIFS